MLHSVGHFLALAASEVEKRLHLGIVFTRKGRSAVAEGLRAPQRKLP